MQFLSRATALIYGIVCYLIQLGALIYATGFVANIAVPKGIDSGQPGPLLYALIINTGLIALFGLQHTIMARPGFKQVWTRIVPEPVERSTYVLATAAVLYATYIFWQPMPGIVWSVDTPWAANFLMAIYWLGWLITFTSTFMQNHYELLGLRQVWRYWQGEPQKTARFQDRWLYKYIRHPLMLGLLIAFWSTPVMTWGHLLFAIGMSSYIFIGIAYEERDLLRQYGEQYRKFRQERPMLIPKLKR